MFSQEDRQKIEDYADSVGIILAIKDELIGSSSIIDKLSEAYLPIQQTVSAARVPANTANNIMNGITAALTPLFEARTQRVQHYENAVQHAEREKVQLAQYLSNVLAVPERRVLGFVDRWTRDKVQQHDDRGDEVDTLVQYLTRQLSGTRSQISSVPAHLPTIAGGGAFVDPMSSSQAMANFTRLVSGGAPRLADRQEFSTQREDDIDTESDDGELIPEDAQITQLPGQIAFRRRRRTQ